MEQRHETAVADQNIGKGDQALSTSRSLHRYRPARRRATPLVARPRGGHSPTLLSAARSTETGRKSSVGAAVLYSPLRPGTAPPRRAACSCRFPGTHRGDLRPTGHWLARLVNLSPLRVRFVSRPEASHFFLIRVQGFRRGLLVGRRIQAG